MAREIYAYRVYKIGFPQEVRCLLLTGVIPIYINLRSVLEVRLQACMRCHRFKTTLNNIKIDLLVVQISIKKQKGTE